MPRKTKVDRVNDKLKGLTKAFKKMNITLKVHPKKDNNPPCHHIVQPSSAKESADYDFDVDNPRIVLDVSCARCGMSGSIQIYSGDVLWE